MISVEEAILKGDEAEDITIEGETLEERKESLAKILRKQKLNAPCSHNGLLSR